MDSIIKKFPHENLKSIFSLIVIGLFIVFAMASVGADKSTNTTVASSNCHPKPRVDDYLHVHVSYLNKAGEPIQNIPGRIFITHQDITDTMTCAFTAVFYDSSLFIGSNGQFDYSHAVFTQHDNSEDLFRIEIVLEKNALYTAFKQVQVVKYSNFNVEFKCIGTRLSEL